jgi:serine phosphatase RsbU (regulator of sigma subunit)
MKARLNTLWRLWSGESRLARAFLSGASSTPQRLLLVIVGAALEVAVMAVLGTLGATRVLGLPGPLAVGIAASVGIFAGPQSALIVGAAGVTAYLGFLSNFGHSLSLGVVVASALLWLVMSVLIALAAGTVRRQVAARLESQQHTEELYQRLEQSLLPGTRASHPLLRIARYYLPDERGLRLGGDFFDLTALSDGTLALVIGDVCGHGPRAAALGAMLRGAWRGVVTKASPATTAQTLHDIALAEGARDDSFATALLAWIDAERNVVRLISAGHPAPLLLGSDASELKVKPFLPLGAFDEAPAWRPSSVHLPAAWTLFFYTDGLTDMKLHPGASERCGVEGLSARLLSLNGHALGDHDLARLVASIAEQSGQPPEDDVAVVAVSKESLDRTPSS